MNDVLSIRSFADHPPIAILGVPFDNVTTEETVALVERMVASRRPHYLVTANVDFLVQAQQDVELRRILFDAHLVLCDGMPLVWASRWLGNPLPERLAGSDLVPLLIQMAARKGYRLFFLGGTPESASRAVANLVKRHPGLQVVGQYAPPFAELLEMNHDEIRRRIAEAQPDLLFVSFGCPKQEKWIWMQYQSLNVPVIVGVGATIDFLAGQVRRAPSWMQRTGTEWIFRLLQEPRRLLRRYLKDLWVFSRSILAQLWEMRFRVPKADRLPVSEPQRITESLQCIKAPERLDIEAVTKDALLVDQVLADGRHCLLDLAAVRFIDSTGMGMLIRLQKKIRATGRQLVLLSPTVAVDRALQLMHLQSFFAIAPDLPAAERLLESRASEQQSAVVPAPPAIGHPLVWRGEITASNIEQVWEATLAQLLPPGMPPRQVSIDLSGVRFLDSSGVGMMVRAKKLAQRQDIRLVFLAPQPAVRNTIQFSRLEEFLLGDEA